MIRTSTSATMAFTPPWRRLADGSPREGATVFHLRAGSVRERGQLEAELSGQHRAGRVFGFELRAAIVEGVSTILVDDPELDRILALVSSDEEGERGADDRRLLDDVRRVLAEHWQPYRDLVAQLERRRELAPIEALRRFCTGIDNGGTPFAQDREGMVSEATLGGLDHFEMLSAGNRAYELLYGGGDQERNFPQPSPSGDAPSTSSRAPSKAGGSSARKSGRKTPA